MNNGIVKLQLWQFGISYILLLLVIFISRRAGLKREKEIIFSSLRMSLQLILTGLILTYIFDNPYPIFPVIYIIVMVIFSVYRVLSQNKGLNTAFKRSIVISIAGNGLLLILFFIKVIVGESVFNPQYVIPLSGMIMGNMMNSTSIAIKTFRDSLRGQDDRIIALQGLGIEADVILRPFARQALDTALLPTLNSMVGMGIVTLPGMMTGQILAGVSPLNAILYQIAIMSAILCGNCLSCYCSLFIGYRSFYNSQEQIISIDKN